MHLGLLQLEHLRNCASCRRRIEQILETRRSASEVLELVPISAEDRGIVRP